MSNGWTPERRLRQSQLIQSWKPWKSAGVKTAEGKAISCMNSYKHGARSAKVRDMERQLTEWRKELNKIINYF